MVEDITFLLANEAATVDFGKQLALAADGKGIFYLEGNLGAGKTTLCRGVLQVLGHQGSVKSPTYTLVEPYELANHKVYHFDLYRLGEPEELEFLGVRDYLQDDNLCLIEWPERGEGFLPIADLTVTLSYRSQGRTVRLTAHTEKGHQVCQRITR
ncbi:tRNA (adenosine(37)-N6)-threonylcarbamoyltransferase complex ATPase subunit type 1 TsaE [Endozoicomonas sp. SM1973]|uniref:tRNA threonylcarbamoyladenosine biosynthesis protein TsaE n=1 Tax=Spartinivicinus marinus TaxID=2994442 RepID=A0A853I9G5_9GAMM|nr:tRNA (adenosine(37)-N6)-threonylcarbamoyltransferase complex ATPase subunit type 1 TsaE [Spartinivicinus marinus]MCX4027598.1 tRNA (adenosine(37)-N6)-threonylcarbamoyltransferase complex ATPase subunit type 1 TsaE [Spartinivicinus marinus]NYZ66704.1 tRNA (adenosine(37)-N6)-threonylcarbamoyltransferase complex ATPase subunit type 1 TsaE [Spartinivicinus marinus]